ncbi:TonB-dependent receptor domain-containing protein [Asticcacaulis sp. AND118]|uniref:TonB-dependent receptor domain-containing protein n=1 Tax=Asticcacaulis sp. AND118 TaxID=2840468 RepID=UPI001CFF668E|nr:TonB-dependent receptor [Asticcacaulis sp. AND118]UDF03552.1 TonB-dependent receptor [Asticcacaulis sp. AND118]
MSSPKYRIRATASLSVLASLLLASAAAAQTAPAAEKPAEKTEEPTTVTVTGAKAQNRIDRQVYDNTKNADTATGSAADALNKVPSVTVDANGNVALRGNTNVQVYIDGKPSAMMQGDNRAGAIQAMSGGDISSVEVINNPGAQFSSEGSGGIINLVMKKNRKPGGYGSVTASVGSSGRYNGNVSGSYTAGKVSYNGGMSYRVDSRENRFLRTMKSLDANGNPTSLTQSETFGDGKMKAFSTNGGVDYNLDDQNTLSAALSYFRRELDATGTGNTATYNAAGAATRFYSGASTLNQFGEDSSLALTWSHTGDQPGETLKTDLRLSRSRGDNAQTNIYTYTRPTSTITSDAKYSSRDLKSAVFSVDYNTPIGQDQLSVGTQITRDDNALDNVSTGVTDLGNTALTNSFEYKQLLTAAYVTYQRPFGDKWVVLAGIRAENLDLDTYQVDTGTRGSLNYTKYSPSLFATYLLSSEAKLRFSYARRLQRPNPQSLNPALSYTDAQNVSQGNPNLKPQTTDSFEVGYEVTKPILNYQIRAYYRQNEDVITQTSRFIANDVLLTSQENGGSGKSGGIEFNLQAPLSKKLMVQTGGNLAYTELTTPQVGTQDATSLSGRLNVSYQATAKDTLQFNFFTSGKQLTGQGYTEPFAMGNLSYSHKLTPKLTVVVNVADPLRTGKTVTYTSTKTVYSESKRAMEAPVFYLALRYNFGGAAPANAQQNQMRMGPGGPGMGPRPGGM